MPATVPPVTHRSITAISGRKDRPVFFVRLNGSPTPNLVIKGDAVKTHSEVSIKWGSKLMKNVQNQNQLVNTEIMTPPEVAVFRQAATGTFAPNSPEQLFSTEDYCWVKMPFVAGLTSGDYREDGHLNLKRAKELIHKLSGATIWNELGRVTRGRRLQWQQ